MKRNRVLEVYYHDRLVGTLAEESTTRRIAFQYADSWISDGFSISPFSLGLDKKVYLPRKDYFDGLFGVFADSLPDSWGRLLVDRMIKKEGVLSDVSSLDRLAIVGNNGMGALTYRPAWNLKARSGNDRLNYDVLAEECRKILERQDEIKDFDSLYEMGSSSGGARPKVIVRMNDSEWIVKFPAVNDDINIGKMEKDYHDCALQCGIDVPDTILIPSKRCKGYFASKRFDRETLSDGKVQRIHMITAAALLELDFQSPSLDYHSLMKLTSILTDHNKKQIDQMYRRMCFNVFAHNRDDHSKNLSFIYDEKKEVWKLSPAYDLTYSSTYYGEHTTSVDGNGKNPGIPEIVRVGINAGLKEKFCKNTASEIKEKTAILLKEYGREHL